MTVGSDQMTAGSDQSLAPAGGGSSNTMPPQGARAMRKLQRRGVVGQLAGSPVFIASMSVVLLWVLVALFWRLMVPFDPYHTDVADTFAAPSSEHLLGTDYLGRDVLSRTLAGASSVLTIAPAATLLGISLGSVIALVSGYYGGRIDVVLMRFVDAVLAFPTLILATVMLALLGGSAMTVVLVIGLLFAAPVSRIVRAPVLAEREQEYVAAARVRKESSLYIMFSEILPNVTTPILVELPLRLGVAILAIGTLSFLQVGLSEPTADWGLDVALGRGYLHNAPWITLAPALALTSLMVAATLAGDSLQRAVRR